MDTSSQRIQIKVNHTYMSLTQEKSLWSLCCTQALVSISTKRIEDSFQQSAHDECLFFKSNMIIFLYVDGCGIASSNMQFLQISSGVSYIWDVPWKI